MSQVIMAECEIAFLEAPSVRINDQVFIPTRIKYSAGINSHGSFEISARISGNDGSMRLPSPLSHDYPRMPPWFAAAAKQMRQTVNDVRNRN